MRRNHVSLWICGLRIFRVAPDAPADLCLLLDVGAVAFTREYPPYRTAPDSCGRDEKLDRGSGFCEPAAAFISCHTLSLTS